MSVFSDAWRQCLREQYKTVIRENDRITRKSLDTVMSQVGFTEDELKQLIVEATMHVDDVEAEFVPELDILQADTSPQVAPDDGKTFQPHPLECQCADCMALPLAPHDDEGQPIPADEVDPERPDEDDSPQQMSMF